MSIQRIISLNKLYKNFDNIKVDFRQIVQAQETRMEELVIPCG